MWASNGNEVSWIDDITPDIPEQQLIIRFDYLKRLVGLQIGALILHILGFGVVAIARLIPDEV